jgi:hypothetical protein
MEEVKTHYKENRKLNIDQEQRSNDNIRATLDTENYPSGETDIIQEIMDTKNNRQFPPGALQGELEKLIRIDEARTGFRGDPIVNYDASAMNIFQGGYSSEEIDLLRKRGLKILEDKKKSINEEN